MKIFILLVAIVTAYSGIESCPNAKCLMANGKPASIGSVACPRSLKLGIAVEIDGKRYVCSDRTAKRYDGRFDIFMGYTQTDHDRAIQWGKQKINVKIF